MRPEQMEIVGPVRCLPFTQEKFIMDVQSCFGQSPRDIEQSVRNVGHFDTYMAKLVDQKRSSGPLTHDDIVSLYSDVIYVGDNVTRSPRIMTPPCEGAEKVIEYEFLKGVAYQKNKFKERKLKALDYGCGTGFYGFLLWMYGYEVTLCDLPTPFFQFLKKRCAGIDDIKFIDVGESLKLDEQYDFIFSFFVMEHLLDPIAIVTELGQHLNNDGIFYLRHDFAGSGLHLAQNHRFHSKDHMAHCSSQEWWNVIEKAGLVQHELNKKSTVVKGVGFLTK